MVFRRKKNQDPPDSSATRLRGRDSLRSDSAGGGSASNPLARRFQTDDEPDTIDLEEPPRFNDSSDREETTTRLLSESPAKSDDTAAAVPDDPVAGFLVIVAGPGRGAVYHVGYGMNAVGRDESAGIMLNHGDERISRRKHCVVTFEPLSSKFYVQPGEGRNLAYLDGEPVLAPSGLNAGQHLKVGDTELRFVPFCGEEFSWEPGER